MADILFLLLERGKGDGGGGLSRPLHPPLQVTAYFTHTYTHDHTFIQQGKIRTNYF